MTERTTTPTDNRQTVSGGLQTVREIQARYDGRNDDLTEDEINELANRFSREFYDDLATEGTLSFERDKA